MCLQVKQLERDKIQLEKELKKLSEEVCKVIMGESQWSQTMLSNLISSKEKELSEISKKQGAIEDRLKDLIGLNVLIFKKMQKRRQCLLT